MRVLLISNLYPPFTRGGAEQVVVHTVRALRAQGHEVAVITAATRNYRDRVSVATETRSLRVSPVIEDGVRVYRFFPWNLFFYAHDARYPAFVRFFWHIFDVFNLQSALKVRRIIGREHPDVIHTHNLKGLGYLIPWVIRQSGIRHVHTLHDVQLITPSSIIFPRQLQIANFKFQIFDSIVHVLSALYARICRGLFGSPQVVISPSRFLHDFYRARGFFPRSEWIILPNPVVSPPVIARSEATKQSHNGVLRDRHGPMVIGPRDDNENGAFRFLYVGQIERHKGVEFLVQTFTRWVEDAQEKAELHIVGDGSRLAKVKTLASGNPAIVFHGKLSREEVQKMYASADATIVPSLCYENSPTVIFESFSRGVPVVASRIEGVAELIRDGENGFTFAAGDAPELMDRLSWCIFHRAELPRLGEAARASLRGLEIGPFIARLLQLYRVMEPVEKPHPVIASPATRGVAISQPSAIVRLLRRFAPRNDKKN